MRRRWVEGRSSHVLCGWPDICWLGGTLSMFVAEYIGGAGSCAPCLASSCNQNGSKHDMFCSANLRLSAWLRRRSGRWAGSRVWIAVR